MNTRHPEQDVGEYPTFARLADVSRATVGYQKPDLEREAVAAFHELARLRAALADALVDRNSYRDWLTVERAHSARVISRERARADAAMVDRNSYQNRLSMERTRADAMERDAERWRAKYHATRRYLRAANKGAELLSKVCQLHTHSVASLRNRLIECERSKP